MERAAIWIFAGLLAYICLVLTSISGKLDGINASNIQYAYLVDTMRQKSAADDIQEMAMTHETQPFVTSTQAGLALIAMISVFASWHLSRLYHTHEWTKAVLRKNFTLYTDQYRVAETRDVLHADQDCVGDPPSPDGRIKNSWLPCHLTRLDAAYPEPQPDVGRDLAAIRPRAVFRHGLDGGLC